MEKPKELVSIGALLQEHFYIFVKNIVAPIRVIIESFIIFSFFLVAEHFLYLIFVTLLGDTVNRIPFIGWVLDGVEICSILAVGTYFVYSTITGLRNQLHIAIKLEKQVINNEEETQGE